MAKKPNKAFEAVMMGDFAACAMQLRRAAADYGAALLVGKLKPELKAISDLYDAAEKFAAAKRKKGRW